MQIDYIKTPYTTRPNMTRWTGPAFNTSPSNFYLEQKRQELIERQTDLYATTYEADINGLVRRANEYCSRPAHFSLVQLALTLEEDIAIMYKGMLAAICFCFPSSWIPRERIGLQLGEIHKPVADGEVLVKMSSRLAETMSDVEQGSFRRHVWTVTTSSTLSNHPAKKENKTAQSIDDLYFRSETQTTVPLGDGISSLFFVKVEVVPLADIWADNKEQILDSINSMSDSIIEYKNLKDIKELLNTLR